MKVITALTRKGGSGKTTMLRALLSASLSQGKSCMVIDADPQKAFVRWQHRVGYESPLLTIESLDTTDQLEPMLDAAYEKGIDYVFIDTLGAAGQWADMLVAQSDHLICPMMPSETDVDITKDAWNYYVGLRQVVDDPSLLPSFSVILSRLPSKPTKAMILAAQEGQRLFPTMLDEMMLERPQHGDVDREGLLHELVERRKSDPNPLIRRHALLYEDALEEAKTILKQIEAQK